MAEDPTDVISPHDVERRLRELEQLYELGRALKEVRFAEPELPDRVQERSGPTEVERLVELELERVKDPGRRARLRSYLTPPALQSFGWNYGADGERYDAWVVGRSPDGTIALAYSTGGFGPSFPWGFVLVAEHTMGADDQWYWQLEEAAVCAGLLERPPQEFPDSD